MLFSISAVSLGSGIEEATGWEIPSGIEGVREGETSALGRTSAQEIDPVTCDFNKVLTNSVSVVTLALRAA